MSEFKHNNEGGSREGYTSSNHDGGNSDFIDQLDVRDEVKAELHRIRPENYTGL